MTDPGWDTSVEALRERLEAALIDGPQPLLTLTDEELVALEPGSDDDRLVVTPHLADMGAEQREWCVATALRSLVAREVVQIDDLTDLDAALRDSRMPQDASVRMRVRLPALLELVLLLRRTADRIVTVHQYTAPGATHAYLYAHGGNVVLDEHVSSGGLHTFTLLDRGAAGTVLHTLIDPRGVAHVDGRPLGLVPAGLAPGAGSPLEPVVDAAHVATQVVLLRADGGAGHGRLLTGYATDDTLWLVQVDTPGDPKGIRAVQVGPGSLARIVATTLAGGLVELGNGAAGGDRADG